MTGFIVPQNPPFGDWALGNCGSKEREMCEFDEMPSIEHVRHKPPTPLEQPRPLIVACPQLNSNVNLSRIVRMLGCCGVTKLIVCGKNKIDPKIARDAAQTVQIEARGSLPPVLKRLAQEGYRIVGLEQTTRSHNLLDYRFERRTVLVLGSERQGITPEVLAEVQETLEIPVWGLPYSYNVATATTIAVYEYCRQFPTG
jgi:tRNA G18 (ribose-2'-O)-methylase SpoU